jgi:hypothetical protein
VLLHPEAQPGLVVQQRRAHLQQERAEAT